MCAISISPSALVTPPGQGHTLLVADDDPALRAVLKNSLEQEGYRVRCASNGAEALDMVRQARPSAAILDIVMPEMDGLQTCRALRAFSDVPVIITSGLDSEGDVIAGLEAGADDYMAKPYSLAVLKARLVSVIRRDAAGRSTANLLYDDGHLTVQVYPPCVRKNGRVVALRPKEYMLLAGLIMRRGSIVSRDTLLMLVWGSDWSNKSRVLAPAISRLRRAIEDTPRTPDYVHTRHHLGYVFQPPSDRDPSSRAASGKRYSE